jgi:hypothetical protein
MEVPMKSLLTAIALSVAFPAIAHAQAPAPEKKADCCEKMKAEGKDCCCKDMAGKDHADHDMKAGGEADSQHKH